MWGKKPKMSKKPEKSHKYKKKRQICSKNGKKTPKISKKGQ